MIKIIAIGSEIISYIIIYLIFGILNNIDNLFNL